MQRATRSAEIRAELGHPVIDGDGHVIEMIPVFTDFIRDHGRGDIVDEAVIFNTVRRSTADESRMPIAQRRAAALVPATWTIPTETEYFATVTQPARYYERLGEAGIDFAVLYPTFGLAIMGSDIGHWDVPEFDSPLADAYELVEHGILDEAQLREFLFTNSVKLYASLNPDFFTGTTVEYEAARTIAAR